MPSVLNHRAYALGTWFVLVVLLMAVMCLTLVQRWLGVAVLGGTVVISAAFVRLQDRLPRVFNLMFVLAGSLNAVAYVFDLWKRIGIYDALIHAYTTFALAAAFGYLAFSRTRLNETSRFWHFMIAITAFGFGVGMSWELFEWLIGIIGDTIDTLVDLAMDTIGAIAAGLFCAWAADQDRRERTKPRQKDVVCSQA